MLDPNSAWLSQRRYPDLDPRAERALREAGLRFSEGAVAEVYLRQAAAIAPEHEAVLVGQYRYYLYKHRYGEAARFARACISQAAERLGIASDPMSVSASELDLSARESLARSWLFACQAYAYVLLRAGQKARGTRLLEHLVAVDTENLSKTVELCAVIKKAEQNEDDD